MVLVIVLVGFLTCEVCITEEDLGVDSIIKIIVGSLFKKSK